MRNRDIPLRKYCDANFREMRPDTETGRVCERCETEVKDLSAMSADEARAVLEREGEYLCVRYLYGEDGDVIFKDRPPKILPAPWLVRNSRAALIAAVILSPAFLEACGPPARCEPASEALPGDDTNCCGTSSGCSATGGGSSTTTMSGTGGTAGSGGSSTTSEGGSGGTAASGGGGAGGGSGGTSASGGGGGGGGGN